MSRSPTGIPPSDCLGLLDHLGIDRAVVGGMSQGGFVSLRVALTAPERVRGLILLDTQAGTEDPATVAGYDQMRDIWLAVGPVDELADGRQHHHRRPGGQPDWIAKWQARPKELFEQPYATLTTRDDITDRLGEITCPAIVIHGTEDTAITMDRAEALAAGLPGAGPVVKVGGAHAANLTNPGPVNEAHHRLPRSRSPTDRWRLQIFGVAGLPEIEAGSDIAALVVDAAVGCRAARWRIATSWS